MTVADERGSPAMLSRTDLRGRRLTVAELRRALPRGSADVDSVVDDVRPVVRAVREHGSGAALDAGERFDGVRPRSVRVPADVVAEAERSLDADVKIGRA